MNNVKLETLPLARQDEVTAWHCDALIVAGCRMPRQFY